MAVALYLRLGRRRWFFLDEWDFLAARTAWNIGDLLRPHGPHWTTLPILAWRALWQAVGLRSYIPYETASILVHVAVAALLRKVMRRAGVQPWVATIAAGAFLFFGAGAQNIFFAFQITFTGALAFGLAHLLLVDHDGPLDYRDWFGLLAGLLGLMCSGIAVTMVAVVGVAAVMRRGLRVAAFHVLPLAATYLAWWAHYGRSGTHVTGTIGSAAGFARTGIDGSFSALAQIPGGGLLLVVSLVAGLALVWRASDRSPRRTRLALPTALLLGVVAFFAITSLGRSGGLAMFDQPTASRYLYVAAALLIPVIAIAVDAMLRRSRVFGTVAAALLIAGVPGNLTKAYDFAGTQLQVASRTREMILSIGRMPLAAKAPGSLQPDPGNESSVTMHWILAGVRSGRIPGLHEPTRRLLATNRLRLSLMQLDIPTGHACARLTASTIRKLEQGERINIRGVVRVSALSPAELRGIPLTFGNAAGRVDHALVAVAGPLTLRITRVSSLPAQLC